MPSVLSKAVELDELLVTTGVVGDVPTRLANGTYEGRQTSFVYIQGAPASTWIINHNLGFRPSVTLLNSGGQTMRAQVIHTSLNQSIAYFNLPASGQARCV